MNIELIACQMANIIDAMCYYSIPAKLWDGQPYPEDLPEPAEALQQTGRLEYSPRGGSEYEQRPSEVVIPNSLLAKAAELVAALEELNKESI